MANAAQPELLTVSLSFLRLPPGIGKERLALETTKARGW
jgi:hypothetical protein